MDPSKKLEFEYAKRLRESNTEDRRRLYFEAYSNVSSAMIGSLKSIRPEDRTAGTSPRLLALLSKAFAPSERILELGCGRGYTCLKLAPFVGFIVGTDVSEPSLNEATELLKQHAITNAEIRKASAFELDDRFRPCEFDACVSIDVYEHLHADDARENLQQAYRILKPGGRYIIFTPNRLTGPHDITRTEFPTSREALGFHLNETTYRDLIKAMRDVGYKRFRILFPLRMESLDRGLAMRGPYLA